MKKKGFTLIELIAVLAILAIIIVISVPQLVDSLNDSKRNASEKIYKTIASAGRLYASDHKLGESVPILVSTLCSENYLDCPLEDPVTEEEISGYIFSSVDYESKTLEYKHYDGTPKYLYPTLIATVNSKDIDVNKYAGNGLYKYGDKYIYRGGITKTNANGLATADYATDVDSGTNVDNYVMVPWEGEWWKDIDLDPNCTHSALNACYRIVSIESDGSIKIVRDTTSGISASGYSNPLYDNTHNTDASTYYSQPSFNYGYNDFLANVPSAGHPEEYRAQSNFYIQFYGPSGYEKVDIYPYRNLFKTFDVCLNKATNFRGLNDTANPTYVSDSCNVTGKPNTTAVAPLKERLVGFPKPEDYLNASTESTCTTSNQYQCRNKNYMYDGAMSLTVNGDYSRSWSINVLSHTGSITISDTNNHFLFRPVMILKANITISGGTGTATDPYILMG